VSGWARFTPTTRCAARSLLMAEQVLMKKFRDRQP
jgi:hypothetical protein